MKKSELKKAISLLLTGFTFSICSLIAQEIINNSKDFENRLPDPLVTLDGREVNNTDMWWNVRRPEILNMVETELYGRAPGPPEKMVTRVVSKYSSEKISYKQVEIELIQGENKAVLDVLICLPADASEPVPVFLGMNFFGNHTITKDTGIIIPKINNMKPAADGENEPQNPEELRGSATERWPIEMVTKRGYGIVTFSRGGGTQGLFPDYNKPGDWGSFAAWAWEMSRVIDYLETDEQVDNQGVMTIGTSRLGKVALWAGATDERIRIVFPMCSGGCGGTSMMSKRFYGEESDEMNCGIGGSKLCGNFQKYLDHEKVLPFDQHMVLALIAPRPICMGTAEGQKEPQNSGMFLALKNAEPVYKLLGTDGLGADRMPGINNPVMNTMGFHIRTGKHGIEDYDWKCFMDFADKHLGTIK